MMKAIEGTRDQIVQQLDALPEDAVVLCFGRSASQKTDIGWYPADWSPHSESSSELAEYQLLLLLREGGAE